MKVNEKWDPKDSFMVLTHITTCSLVSITYICPQHLFSFIRDSVRLTRKKDLDSSSQWHHDLFTYACMLSRFSRVQLFGTPRTVVHQAPLSMGFSRQEYWSGLPFPTPGDLPDPGIEPASPAAPYLQADSLLLNHWGSPWKVVLNKDVGKINPSKTAPFSTPSERYGPAAAAAKSLQSCPTLCDPIDGSPPGSPVPGILQARTLEWVAIYFSNARKWKVKVKLLSCVWIFETPWTAAYQAPLSMGFSRQECWSGLPLPSPMVLLGPLKWEWLKNCPNTTSPVKLSLSLILTGKTNPASPPRSSMGF